MSTTRIIYMSPLYLNPDEKDTTSKSAPKIPTLASQPPKKKHYSEIIKDHENARRNQVKRDLFRSQSAPPVLRTTTPPLTFLSLIQELNASAAAIPTAAATVTTGSQKKPLNVVESPHHNTYHEDDFTNYKFGNSG